MVYNDTTKHKNVGCNPIFQATKQQWNAEKRDVGYLPGVGWAVLIVPLLSSVFGRRLACPLSKLRFLSVHKVKKLSCLCLYFANVSLCCIDMYICCSSMYMHFVLCVEACRLKILHTSDVVLIFSTTKLYFISLWDNCQYIVCVCMSEWQRDKDFTS